MKSLRSCLPLLTIVALLAAAVYHGPVAQLPHYHEFADQTTRYGIAHFADVASNLGFALAALYGAWRYRPADQRERHGAAGYRLFLLSLLLTAFGSSWYHLAPDDARLVWDRLPIALACAGLLAGVWGDTQARASGAMATLLSGIACAGVAWWHATGDLRPYLLLQAAPLLLIPLWQGLHGSPAAERRAFGMALLLYVAAKLAELHDHDIAALTAAAGGLTGHTLKHLLASAAAAVIVGRLCQRTHASGTTLAL